MPNQVDCEKIVAVGHADIGLPPGLDHPAASQRALLLLQGYSRLVAQDYEMDEVTLPAGSRAIVFYGAANRDERKFPDPHRFDVTRNAAEQLAFGSGPHACIGLHLAILNCRTCPIRKRDRLPRRSIIAWSCCQVQVQ